MGIRQMFSIPNPPVTYNKFKFKIRKPLATYKIIQSSDEFG